MLSLLGKIKLLWLLLYKVVNFFINKAELELSLMFHYERYLVEFASFTSKNTYNIQSITPPIYFGQLYQNRIVLLLR
jgi:hypothetical protein